MPVTDKVHTIQFSHHTPHTHPPPLVIANKILWSEFALLEIIMYSKPVDKQNRLRQKLVNNEMNPIADAILSLVLLGVTPFIWMFAQIHDRLMFKFLNNTYIYNVSWEVFNNNIPIYFHFSNVASSGPSHGSPCFPFE